jgi:hypothetical protein
MFREPISKYGIGLPKDRRLREDGFIILAQAMIRTDGFFRPCKVSPKAARQF